jgi:glycosyltransferase involved in cell wall biosynthesis
VDLEAVPKAGYKERSSNTILFLGRLEREKGIFELVDSVAKIRAEFPNTKLQFAGCGDVDGIRDRAKQLGIGENVEFLGWVSGTAKTSALAEAAIFVLPSYSEGLPIGLLEAMAASLPIVATAVGGIPDLVTDGTSGLLVQPKDPDALAGALLNLLRDPSLRARLGNEARRQIEERYASARVMPQIDALYRRLIRRG